MRIYLKKILFFYVSSIRHDAINTFKFIILCLPVVNKKYSCILIPIKFTYSP